MSFIVEAIYESGVLKLLTPLPQLKEQERYLKHMKTETEILRAQTSSILADAEAASMNWRRCLSSMIAHQF